MFVYKLKKENAISYPVPNYRIVLPIAQEIRYYMVTADELKLKIKKNIFLLQSDEFKKKKLWPNYSVLIGM